MEDVQRMRHPLAQSAYVERMKSLCCARSSAFQPWAQALQLSNHTANFLICLISCMLKHIRGNACQQAVLAILAEASEFVTAPMH